jgi:hypothetical protein
MSKLKKALIQELIDELTALRDNIPDDKDNEYQTTLSLTRYIRKVNDLNWSLCAKFGKHYGKRPSFDRKP